MNIEVWYSLPGAPLRNRVKGCNYENHLDSERVAGCPPPSCWPSSICVHELPLTLVKLKLNVPGAPLTADWIILLNLG